MLHFLLTVIGLIMDFMLALVFALVFCFCNFLLAEIGL